MSAALIDKVLFQYEFDQCRIIALLDSKPIGFYTARNNTFFISYGWLSKVAEVAEIEKFTLNFMELYKIGIAYREPHDFDYLDQSDTLEERFRMRRALWTGTTVIRNV